MRRATARKASPATPAARLLLAAAIGLIALTPVVAQADGGIETDEDALFGSTGDDALLGGSDEDALFGGSDDDGLSGGDALVTEIQKSETDMASTLLVSERVEIGGRFSMGLNASWGWNDVETVGDLLEEPDSSAFSTPLSARLFFDARPDEDFRVYGRMTASYPFATDPDDPADPSDAVRELDDVFHVDELFSDFNWREQVFFRAGKQTMNWGVGYFFSPADLLNISEIDPEDPEADREGPIAVRANVPIGTNNFYLYAVPAFADELLDVGVAAKGEAVLGGAEIALGAIYQRDIAPAAMLTVSWSAWVFDVFAEGVVSYGSNRTFVRESSTAPLGVEAYTRTDEFVLSATAGGRWNHTFEGSTSSLMVLAQYLYNGEGYADPALLSDNAAGIAMLIGSGGLSPLDLLNRGRHYTAAQVSLTDILGSGLNAGVYWMQNFSDFSARIVPSVSVNVLERIGLSFQLPVSLGQAGDELAPAGNSFGLGLNVSIGGGSF